MSSLVAWHALILLGVLAIIALIAGLVLFAVYWVARAGAQRGAAEQVSGPEHRPQ
jgi:hypothetical protein